MTESKKMSQMSRRDFLKLSSFFIPPVGVGMAVVAASAGDRKGAQEFLSLAGEGTVMYGLAACAPGLTAPEASPSTLSLIDGPMTDFAFVPPQQLANGALRGGLNISPELLATGQLELLTLSPEAAASLDLAARPISIPVATMPDGTSIPLTSFSVDSLPQNLREPLVANQLTERVVNIGDVLPAMFADNSYGVTATSQSLRNPITLNGTIYNVGDPRIISMQVSETHPGVGIPFTVRVDLADGQVIYTTAPRAQFDKAWLQSNHALLRHGNSMPWNTAQVNIPDLSANLSQNKIVGLGDYEFRPVVTIQSGRTTMSIAQTTGPQGANFGATAVIHSAEVPSVGLPEKNTMYNFDYMPQTGVRNPSTAWTNAVTALDEQMQLVPPPGKINTIAVAGQIFDTNQWAALPRESKINLLRQSGAQIAELPASNTSVYGLLKGMGRNILSVGGMQLLTVRWGQVMRDTQDQGRNILDVMGERFTMMVAELPIPYAGLAVPTLTGEIDPNGVRTTDDNGKPVILIPTMVAQDIDIGFVHAQTNEDILLPLYVQRVETPNGPSIQFLSTSFTTETGTILDGQYVEPEGAQVCKEPEPVIVPLQTVETIPTRDEFNTAMSSVSGFPWKDAAAFPQDWDVSVLTKTGYADEGLYMTDTMYAVGFKDAAGKSVVYFGRKRVENNYT